MNGQDPQFEIAEKDSLPQFISVGKVPSERQIAYLRRMARGEAAKRPGMVWLGGFKSDMRSVKATALDAWAKDQGRA